MLPGVITTSSRPSMRESPNGARNSGRRTDGSCDGGISRSFVDEHPATPKPTRMKHSKRTINV